MEFGNELECLLVEDAEVLFDELDRVFGEERKVPDGPVDIYVKQNGVIMDVSGITALQHTPNEINNSTNIINMDQKQNDFKETSGVDSKLKSMKAISIGNVLKVTKDKRMGELHDQSETLSKIVKESEISFKKNTDKPKQQDPNGQPIQNPTDSDTGRDDDEEH